MTCPLKFKAMPRLLIGTRPRRSDLLLLRKNYRIKQQPIRDKRNHLHTFTVHFLCNVIDKLYLQDLTVQSHDLGLGLQYQSLTSLQKCFVFH